MPILFMTPAEFALALQAGGGACLDVREPGEFAAERIAGVASAPLSGLARHAPADAGAAVFLVCRSGIRARQAAELLAAAGATNLRVLEGGLNGWKAAGLPVEGDGSVWALERQVRFTAGALVLAGFVLARWLHPGFVLLSAGVGAGLVITAATGTCGLALLLARMPWNRRSRRAPCPAAPDAPGGG